MKGKLASPTKRSPRRLQQQLILLHFNKTVNLGMRGKHKLETSGRRLSRRLRGSEVDDSPVLNIPHELLPHNHPGRRDFAIVLPSRLRDRGKKKTEDVPYIHVAGQRRCIAIEESEPKKCGFCAVGMSDYCHAHAYLESDSSSSDDDEEKDEEEVQSKPEIVNAEKVNETASSIAGLERIMNNKNQCIAIGKGRVTRCAKRTQKGKKCCPLHAGRETKGRSNQRTKKFNRNSGAVQCIALGESRCLNAALDGVVFCPKHFERPPGEVAKEIITPDVDSIVSDKEDSEQHSEPAPEPKKKRITSQRSNKNNNGNKPVAVQCEHRNDYGDRCCYEVAKGKSYCRMHFLTEKSSSADDMSRLSLDVEEESDAQQGTCRKAESLEDRCVFTSPGGDRCENQVLPGSITCSQHFSTGLFYQQSKQNTTEESDSRGEEDDAAESDDQSDSDESESNSDSDSDEDSSSIQSEFSEESESEDSEIDLGSLEDRSAGNRGVYTHEEYMDLWRYVEGILGESTDDIENSQAIRGANSKVDPGDTDGQVKAQYGRLLPMAMKKMMKLLEMDHDDIFLDIGHGIGNTVFHSALCVGCESRGIEVVKSRHAIAEVFHSQIANAHQVRHPERVIGKIDLRLGQLEDPQHREFLTKGVTRAYVNNFNGVFAERSAKNHQKWFLDDYIAGIFALLAPGAIMITFHPLSLGLAIEEANAIRKKHGLKESKNASFFRSEKVLLGRASKAVKWCRRSGNTSDIYVYKYWRLHQPHGEQSAFLCCNPQCENAKNETPIPAVMENEDGRFVMNHCECRYSPKNLRRRSREAGSD